MTAGPDRQGEAMHLSPRCGAMTRHGTPCRNPAVRIADDGLRPGGEVIRYKARCRMHGGAKGSGAPRGNSNALKSGAYTREKLELYAALRGLLHRARNCLREEGMPEGTETPRKRLRRTSAGR